MVLLHFLLIHQIKNTTKRKNITDNNASYKRFTGLFLFIYLFFFGNIVVYMNESCPNGNYFYITCCPVLEASVDKMNDKVNLHCYTSCTLTTLHCSKVSFLQCCHMKRYNKIFTKM